MTDPAPATGRGTPPALPQDRRRRAVDPAALCAVAALTVAADLLFWDVPPGLSVAIYTLLVAGCIVAFRPGGASRREAAIVMGGALLSVLPVVEQVQTLSLLFAIAGVLAVAGWAALGRDVHAWPLLQLLARATGRGAVDFPATLIDAARGRHWDGGNVARNAVLPVAFGGLFLVLFASANPLLEDLVLSLGDLAAPDAQTVLRVIFWIFVACLIWPYLTLAGAWRGSTQGPQPPIRLPVQWHRVVNTGSVRSSLILFNAMFALQTVTDLGVLSGGMTLPDGITYAEYAHRGAYPLAITALLSGLFAVSTHHLTQGDRVLRLLMLTWLAQNIVLVLTAVFRLDLYVDAYSLTYMRIAAFVGMGLTFGSLVLIVIYLLRGHPLTWLIRGVAELTISALYICCFINFAHLITEHNMAATPPERLDLGYLCDLGEQAIPAMMEYGQITDNVACGRDGLAAIRFDPIDDWRDWGFRRWRLQRYLEAYHDL